MQKVLIIVPYSFPSKCGIWVRAWSDAQFLKSKGYDVTIFSSKIIKGTKQKSSNFEEIDGIIIRRFNVLFSLGSSSMFWIFIASFLKLKPDIVHVHGYRHPHTLQGFFLAKLTRKKIFITTHAPFEKDSSRSIILKIFDRLYDLIFGWWELRSYNKVIRISKWEEKYIKHLGVNNSVYIPNGISQIFTKNQIQIAQKPHKRIIYMGRIDPVKRLEWLIYAAKELPEYKFYIRGPLNVYSNFESQSDNLIINSEKFEPSEFIDELSKSDIFVLPSIREALPFTLLEAMSQGIIPLSSENNGGREVISDGNNGYLFNNEVDLVNSIKKVYENWDDSLKIKLNAIKKSKEYDINEINNKLLELYTKK